MATILIQQNILPRAAAWTASAQRGGHVMFVLQWLEGLKRLGHRPVLVNLFNAADNPEAQVNYFRTVIDQWWSLDDAILLQPEPLHSMAGLALDAFQQLVDEAKALITIAISGTRLPVPPLNHVRPRVLVEQDPAYTHLWAQTTSDPNSIFGVHDFYFTVGGNIGTERCAVPTAGLPWKNIWNPIVSDWWDYRTRPDDEARFTTVADWWGQGYLEFQGNILGPKREEFLRFLGLPQACGENIRLILDIPPADPDIEKIATYGWTVNTPAIVSSPDDYRQFIQASVGEFSCAKGVYVGTNSGWFSDRSACYLAAGRPVVIQDTGLEGHFPLGMGLFAVRTVGEAAAAIRNIRQNYDLHSHAAREIAEKYLASDVVLPALLEQIGI